MIIEISDTVVERAGLTEEDLRLRLAVILFKEDMLTLGQAAELAGMHQIMFQKELAQRQIPIHYDIEDFEQDWQTIKQF